MLVLTWKLAAYAAMVCAQYVSRKLEDPEIATALQLAADVRGRRNDEKTNAWPMRDLPEANRFYDPLDVTKQRWNAIGKLFIVPYESKSLATTETGSPVADNARVVVSAVTKEAFDYGGMFQFRHCSAFFVAPDILASGAHCIVRNGITKTSKHVMIFRQQYDGTKPYDKDEAATHEHVVVEWIYMKAFDGLYADAKAKGTEAWSHESGFDVAFLRTHRKSHGDAHYTLVSPDDFLLHKKATLPVGKTTIKKKMVSGPVPSAVPPKTNAAAGPKETGEAEDEGIRVLTVGYPHEYAEYYEAVSVSCKLAKATDPPVLADKGYQRAILEYKQDASVIMAKQLFCVGAKGNLSGGGSGGPWLLAEDYVERTAKNEKEKQAMLRWVVGLQSWSFKVQLPKGVGPSTPNFLKIFLDEHVYSRTSLSPWIRPQHVEMLKVITGRGAKETMEQALLKGFKVESIPVDTP